MKISKRDVLFFVMGFMTLLVIELVYDWDNNVKAFKEGWSAAKESRKAD